MTTLEAAQEKVRAHCKEVPALKFKRLSAYSIVSECGEFFVSRVSLSGEISYEVWFKAKGGKTAINLRMNLPTALEAKAWASSIANAYHRGHLGLTVPLSPEEIEHLRAVS